MDDAKLQSEWNEVEQIDVVATDVVTALAGKLREESEYHGDKSGYRMVLEGSGTDRIAVPEPTNSRIVVENPAIDPQILLNSRDEIAEQIRVRGNDIDVNVV